MGIRILVASNAKSSPVHSVFTPASGPTGRFEAQRRISILGERASPAAEGELGVERGDNSKIVHSSRRRKSPILLLAGRIRESSASEA